MLYNKIRDTCEKKHIKVSHVEKEAGLSKGAIAKWKSSSPSVDNLKAVAKVLKVSVDYLLKE